MLGDERRPRKTKGMITYEVLGERGELHAGAFLDYRPAAALQVKGAISATVQSQLPAGNDEDTGSHAYDKSRSVDGSR